MLDEKGFDLWAQGYDDAVGLSDGQNTYPFAGYKQVLAKICRRVLSRERPAVLDVGFGTGTLTAELYRQGCRIYGQDFSAAMLRQAQRRMPDAQLYQADFSKGLAAPLLQNRYDFILATYSLHHLTDAEKIPFLRGAAGLLKEDGAVLIGDVAFADRAGLESCRQAAGGSWDEDEYYFVFDELRRELPALEFEPVSYCAGVLTLRRAAAR